MIALHKELFTCVVPIYELHLTVLYPTLLCHVPPLQDAMQKLLAFPKPLIVQSTAADVHAGGAVSELQMGDPQVGSLLSPCVLAAVKQRSMVLGGEAGSKEVGCNTCTGGCLNDAVRSTCIACW